MPMYLDYNASCPLHPEVAEEVCRAIREEFGNPSSVHAYGQRAKAALDRARAAVAALLGAAPAEVVFTGGGTESDNFAIRGAAESLVSADRRHLVASGIEHEAILNTIKALARRGWKADLVPPTADGVVEPDRLRAVIRDDTALVSIMHANNETGVVQPITELAAVCHERGALVHTDAVQSAGKIPVDVGALGVDLLSISAHKFGGPKGVGALWVRPGTRLSPLLTGGRQERNRRAGTENVPAIVGLGAAARIGLEKLEGERRRLTDLRDRMERAIVDTVPGSVVNGGNAPRVPNTSNIAFDRVEAESLLIALDLEGIAVSTGSACSSGTMDPSHVLMAMGLPPERVQGSIRFSLGAGTTGQEIDRLLEVLPRLVARLRSVGRR
jgi:cysteine desulfurase